MNLIIILSIAGVILILLLLWAFFWQKYATHLGKLSAAREEVLVLLETRLNTLPLLISLMTPHVVKAEDVFLKIIKLRQQLLSEFNDEKEENLTEQIGFILKVAREHKEIIADKRFQSAQKELERVAKELRESMKRYNSYLEDFNRLRKKSKWLLFPGYFLIHPAPLDLRV